VSHALQVVPGGQPTMRVRNEAQMAAASGWTVDVMTFAEAGVTGDWEWGAVEYGPSPPLARRVLRKASRVVRQPDEPLDVNFPYYESVERVLDGSRYDVVHWKDLSGALTGARIAHRHGVRFVLDCHENYPYNLWSTERDLGISDGFYNLNAWFRYERRAVDEADFTLVTIDEMAQRLVGMHGADPNRLVVVHNTEPPERWQDVPEAGDLQARFDGRLVILYGGSCSLHRGIDTIVRALAEVRESLPEAALVLVGDGPGIEVWRKLAHELGVSDLVFFEGVKPFEELQAYNLVAAFGVVPHHKYGQTDNTVPHKLYQNMMAGRPTLVSSCHTLQRIITETRAGVVFEAGYPCSAARAIRELADPGLRRELGENAYAAVNAPPFSWAHSQAALLEAYTRPL
jgi:glycosyltransferase involved in cell wall biosynthesis